jgi:molybdate transport system substrate-binding protein
MSGLALEVAVNRWLKPAFEARSPYRLEIDWRPTTAIMKSIAEGQRADIVIGIADSIDKLCADRIVRPETRTRLADSVLGVGVKQGAPKPDVSTVDAFKHAMTGARAVAYSRAGASGIYFTGLIERLGIAAEVKARAVAIPMGFTGEKVASGEADLAIQQISELMSVPGVDIAGPFPSEIQTVSTFDAAIFADAANPEGAAAFMAMLSSPDAVKAYEDGGLVSRLSRS